MTAVDHARPPGWVPAVGLGQGPSGPGPPAGRVPWPTVGQQRPVGVEPDQQSRVHLRPSTTAVGLAILAVLAFLVWLATDADPHLAIAAALVVALLVDLFTARQAIARVSLRLHGPALARAGERTEWLVRVDGARRPVAVRPALHVRPQPVLVEDALPGRVTLPPFVLGVVHHLVFDVTATGPIGLFVAGCRYQVSPTSPVHVGPSPLAIDPDWPRPRAVGFGMSEVAPLGDDLFRSVRPYVRGDERRRVHWKATAHHGELMVRESDGTGLVALQVVVDLGSPGPASERVAGWAAFVAEEALQRGWLVQLVTLDARPTSPRVLSLGSPFGPPPVVASPPVVPVEAVSRRVATRRAVNQQLATAAYGSPRIPRWAGLTCVVGPSGVTWP